MPTYHQHAKQLLEKLFNTKDISIFKSNLEPNTSPQQRIPSGNDAESFRKRWELLKLSEQSKHYLTNDLVDYQQDIFNKNIENFIGTVKVPLGLAGPLRVNGLFAKGDYFIPLATTEAALVASYNRGMRLISEVGGCTSILLNAYVTRSPCFAFNDLREVAQFLMWVNDNQPRIKEAAESTTRFGTLLDFRFNVEGNHVFMSFDYDTADASGQNMVTIATQSAFNYIKANSPVAPRYAFVESNMSGDKKASVLAFQNTRGRKVVVEVVLPKSLVEAKLHTTVDAMIQFSQTSSIGALLSGTIGVQGHYANALAAMYIACGQDAACVSESSLGVTRFEKTTSGDLYVSVTLPNLMVGTIGGGTHLPSQKACLDILGITGHGQANALAEVIAGVCLAGEISISAAMASDTFTQAHQSLARTNPVAIS